jgi:DNA replication protein DnaC
MLTTEPRSVICTTCSADFTGLALVNGNKELPFTHLCPACCAAAKQADDSCVAENRVRREEESRRLANLRRDEARRAALERLKVPQLYRAATLGTFQLHGSQEQRELQGLALANVHTYLTSWPDVPGFIVLAGRPGTGKTHILWSIARDIALRLIDGVSIVKLPDLVREIRDCWTNSAEETESDVLKRYRRLAFLGIDEVSRHAFLPRNCSQHLYDIIDHRLEHGRPTILTTNEDESVLGDMLKPALVDRLQGSGGLIELGAESYRLRDITQRS